MEFKNDLDVVAGVASRAVLHAKYHDSDGKVKDIMGTGAGNGLDLDDFRREFIPLSTDNHPSTGVDYYAGSLAEGEITERNLLYQRSGVSTDNLTIPKTITLIRDVGTKFNMAGDGATFLLHVQKTVMTAGVKGTVSNIELNYDVQNIVKEGYFTTTSVHPLYIKATDLATNNELDIPIEGIGENISGKNFLAPHIKIKFNGDGTMTFTSVTGYDNDGNIAGATGANYDIVIDIVATFSTQNAVSQLPVAVNFFNGDASGDIALTGVSKYFEDSNDGLEIDFDQFGYFHTNYDDSKLNDSRGPFINGSDVKIDVSEYLSKIRIPKEFLIAGTTFDAISQLPVSKANLPFLYRSGNNPTYGGFAGNTQVYISRIGSSLVKINDVSINISMTFYIKVPTSTGTNNYTGAATLNVVKVTPYKI